VKLVASGLGTPTAFAFGDKTVFESDAGSQSPMVQGGVYVLAKGNATRVPGSPPVSFGIVWRGNTLYVSAGTKILAWSGWNGKKFAKQRVFYKGPKKFPGFDGLGFGANGRLYAGVFVGGPSNDHGPATAPFQYDILSFDVPGGKPSIFAKGIRQPWQMAFPSGSNSPYVSDLGQDSGANQSRVPDFILRVKAGQNYGFPKCNWIDSWKCAGDASPWWFFKPHTDVMGMAIAGKNLYMTDFGAGAPPQVNYMPLTGGKVKPLLTGFVAPIVGLGINGHWLYVGELTGQIWRVSLK
jgi:glucose/arabinose dehydrogenase